MKLIVFNVFGSVNVVSDVHPLNAYELIVSIDPHDTVANEVHP